MCIASKSLLKHGNCCSLSCVLAILYTQGYIIQQFFICIKIVGFLIRLRVFLFLFPASKNFSRHRDWFSFFPLLKLISFVMSNQFRKLFPKLNLFTTKWNSNWTNRYQPINSILYLKKKELECNHSRWNFKIIVRWISNQIKTIRY